LLQANYILIRERIGNATPFVDRERVGARLKFPPDPTDQSCILRSSSLPARWRDHKPRSPPSVGKATSDPWCRLEPVVRALFLLQSIAILPSSRILLSSTSLLLSWQQAVMLLEIWNLLCLRLFGRFHLCVRARFCGWAPNHSHLTPSLTLFVHKGEGRGGVREGVFIIRGG
jgi:hypothetical protein